MNTIGRYKIRALLGHGGMSKVYLVSLPVIGNTAALKRLDPHPSLKSILSLNTIREQFTAEAKTMAKLRHPNIVAIQDFDEADGALFYVMEYFSNNLGDLIGETYRTEAPSRRLPIDKAIYYTQQMLSGVSRLHHDGIIHRDIKPYNLLITEQDEVKICDFGLSKLRGEDTRSPDNLKVGSPFYAAPEQEEAPEQVGFESDIFSIAVVFYRMLTGHLPYTETDAPLIPASRLNPDLDSVWDSFFFDALAPHPADRISDCDTLSLRLAVLASAWAEKKEQTCRLPLPCETEKMPGINAIASLSPSEHLRRTGIKVRPGSAREAFEIDALGRPARYCPACFQQSTPLLVQDVRTGLFWQKGGAAYPMTWEDTRDYITFLNRMRYEGLSAWRLPTIPELMTILAPPPQHTDYCIPSVFDAAQRCLWSSDKSSYTSAWYVNLEMGYVSKNDFSALYSVKAVCNAPVPSLSA